MRILVVEDDIDVRDMLRTLLQFDGHDVAAARNGEEGWLLFQRDRFSMVISDWVMPDMDGLELSRRIRASESSSYSYILLLTALYGKKNYLTAVKLQIRHQ